MIYLERLVCRRDVKTRRVDYFALRYFDVSFVVDEVVPELIDLPTVQSNNFVGYITKTTTKNKYELVVEEAMLRN